MGQGRFINQKLGKRVSRKLDLTKARISGQKNPYPNAGPKAKRSDQLNPQKKNFASM